MEKIDLEKIKNRAVNIVYECENKYYITEIVKVEKDFNGYGAVKWVTFNGLRECVRIRGVKADGSFVEVNKEGDVLFEGEFTDSFQKSVLVFDRVPFGSKVSLKCKPKVEISDTGERLELTYPKNLTVIDRGEGCTFEDIVKLPFFNLYSEVAILEQLSNASIDYSLLSDEQKERVNRFEIWRQQNIKKNKN